jgi:hypothetical protein
MDFSDFKRIEFGHRQGFIHETLRLIKQINCYSFEINVGYGSWGSPSNPAKILNDFNDYETVRLEIKKNNIIVSVEKELGFDKLNLNRFYSTEPIYSATIPQVEQAYNLFLENVESLP